jgi:inositol 1,4,5-triphosphate receptor type 3
VEKLERNRDTLEVCFICGINKQVFDRASDEPEGFKTHIKVDHNMWNYLYFIFMLWEQDKDDDDGLEQYVRRAIGTY